jgi:hypothetical protein
VSTFYDSSTAPDPQTWLSMPPREQIRLMRNFYARTDSSGTSQLQILLHVSVETRVASGHGPTRKAMLRLMSGGLSRQDAIAAICQALLAAGICDIPGRASLESDVNRALHQL